MKNLFLFFARLCTTGLQAQTLESSSHSTTGYIRPDGTIGNSSHSTRVCIRNDGRLEDASHETIGYARQVKKEWAALLYFFFKMND